jgi:hypothetical protein
MLNCHCRDCQGASGSAYAAVVAVPKNAVQMRGEPRYYKVVGKGGKAIERGFCPTCGSQVTVKLERLPDVLGLQAGSLDDPSIDHLAAGLQGVDIALTMAGLGHAFGWWDSCDPKAARLM